MLRLALLGLLLICFQAGPAVAAGFIRQLDTTNAAGAMASGSGTYNGTARVPSRGFDGSILLEWASNNNNPSSGFGVDWIGYNFGSVETISEIYIHQGSSNYVTLIRLQVSNDNITWYQNGIYDVSAGSNHFEPADHGPWKMWRIVQGTNVTGGTTFGSTSFTGWLVNEIEFYADSGIADPSPAPTPTPLVMVQLTADTLDRLAPSPGAGASATPTPGASGEPTPAPEGGGSAPQYLFGMDHSLAMRWTTTILRIQHTFIPIQFAFLAIAAYRRRSRGL